MNSDALELIKTRRVIRVMTDAPVERVQLEQILEAARWAPVGGNHRFLRFSAIQDPIIINLLRMVSPGMIQRPQAVITICANWDKLAELKVKGARPAASIDVGAVMQTMLLAAHALKLGSGPVTSFNKVAVGIILNLPDNVTPELMVCIGHPATGNQMPMAPKKKITWQSLVDWGRLEK